MLRLITYSAPNPLRTVSAIGNNLLKYTIHIKDGQLGMVNALGVETHIVATMDHENLAITEFSTESGNVMVPLGFNVVSDPTPFFSMFFDMWKMKRDDPVVMAAEKIVRDIVIARYDVVCTEDGDCEVYQPTGDPEYEPSPNLYPGTIATYMYLPRSTAIEMAMLNRNPKPLLVSVAMDSNGEIGAIGVQHENMLVIAVADGDSEFISMMIGSPPRYNAHAAPPGKVYEAVAGMVHDVFGDEEAVFVGAIVVDKRRLVEAVIREVASDAHDQPQAPLNYYI